MCGVAGICLHPQGKEIILRMANALRHRGQSATGVACYNVKGGVIRIEKGRGGVDTAFDGTDKLDEMDGEFWMAHTRYPTAGANTKANQQPQWSGFGSGRFVVAANGDFNQQAQREFLASQDITMDTDNDAEVLAATLGYHVVNRGHNMVEAIQHTMEHVPGAFSTMAMFGNKRYPYFYAFRDPNGIRPLIYAKITDFRGRYHLFASETCAIYAAYAFMRSQPNSNGLEIETMRWVEPGEIIEVAGDGSVKSFFYHKERFNRLCLMEMFYFSRPDSLYDLKSRISFDTLRNRLGAAAYKQFNIDADLVGPVPRSGKPFSMGYANASGIHYREFIIRNPELHQHVRNFIEPDREATITEKYRIINDIVRGKRVLVGDDSVIEGKTSRILVQVFRKIGVKEVQFLSSAPPCQHPCFLGMHYKDPLKLVAYRNTLDEISDSIGCPVNYLDLKRTYQTEGFTKGEHCDGCFTGNYPV